MALNAGRVESTKGAFSLYWEGMSPSVCNVMQDIDSELIAIGKKFGFAIPDSKSSFKAAYGLKGDTLYEVIQNSENHGHSGAPATLKDRYIMEDAPAGLCAASDSYCCHHLSHVAPNWKCLHHANGSAKICRS